MDRESLVRELREAERVSAVGWRGASAEQRFAAAMRQLLAEFRASEDPSYEMMATLAPRRC